MRTLTDHAVDPLNEALTITVEDEPGAGGACHRYCIGYRGETPAEGYASLPIHFQEGPIGEAGVNGISGEALLAIVVDRLRCFQAGQYKCRENALALTHLEESLMWLHMRTRARQKRGVEGTHAL